MFVGGLRAAAVAAVAAPLFALGGPVPVASADPGVLVYPGMEIHQGTTRCTLGYVDPAARTGYTAGHCRGDGPVTDKNGRFIGTMITFRDNTPTAPPSQPTTRSRIGSPSRSPATSWSTTSCREAGYWSPIPR